MPKKGAQPKGPNPKTERKNEESTREIQVSYVDQNIAVKSHSKKQAEKATISRAPDIESAVQFVNRFILDAIGKYSSALMKGVVIEPFWGEKYTSYMKNLGCLIGSKFVVCTDDPDYKMYVLAEWRLDYDPNSPKKIHINFQINDGRENCYCLGVNCPPHVKNLGKSEEDYYLETREALTLQAFDSRNVRYCYWRSVNRAFFRGADQIPGCIMASVANEPNLQDSPPEKVKQRQEMKVVGFPFKRSTVLLPEEAKALIATVFSPLPAEKRVAQLATACSESPVDVPRKEKSESLFPPGEDPTKSSTENVPSKVGGYFPLPPKTNTEGFFGRRALRPITPNTSANTTPKKTPLPSTHTTPSSTPGK